MRIATDIGGTFTDLVGLDPATGEVIVAKVPSTPPEFERGVAAALDAAAAGPAARGQQSAGRSPRPLPQRERQSLDGRQPPRAGPEGAARRGENGCVWGAAGAGALPRRGARAFHRRPSGVHLVWQPRGPRTPERETHVVE
ncbi:MAG: hypothetical protein IMW98_08180 [Firmicutes bacterium]|nr:hypothetical protein [Bacillota bacterium]